MYSKNNRYRLSSLLVIALLMAMEIVLTRLLSINTPLLRISLGFIPVSLIAIMYGPLWAAGAYAMCDIIGAILFPTGTFFPGFTLTAFLTGLTFGLFLYKHPVSWSRVLPASLIICILFNTLLNSLWLYILMHNGFLAFVPMRLVKNIIMVPLHSIMIPLVWSWLKRIAPLRQ
ncbi:membrane protein [Clostridia bacterium]|nr:membrane protein [Clostridia bacterium]